MLAHGSFHGNVGDCIASRLGGKAHTVALVGLGPSPTPSLPTSAWLSLGATIAEQAKSTKAKLAGVQVRCRSRVMAYEGRTAHPWALHQQNSTPPSSGSFPSLTPCTSSSSYVFQILAPWPSLDVRAMAKGIALGIHTGAYETLRYKSEAVRHAREPTLRDVYLLDVTGSLGNSAAEAEQVTAGLTEAHALAHGVCMPHPMRTIGLMGYGPSHVVILHAVPYVQHPAASASSALRRTPHLSATGLRGR